MMPTVVDISSVSLSSKDTSATSPTLPASAPPPHSTSLDTAKGETATVSTVSTENLAPSVASSAEVVASPVQDQSSTPAATTPSHTANLNMGNKTASKEAGVIVDEIDEGSVAVPALPAAPMAMPAAAADVAVAAPAHVMKPALADDASKVAAQVETPLAARVVPADEAKGERRG